MGSGKLDQAKGRVKEAAGTLTDNKKLKNEGKLERVAGKIKEKLTDAVDKAKDTFEDDR